jgi:hypothetical protein
MKYKSILLTLITSFFLLSCGIWYGTENPMRTKKYTLMIVLAPIDNSDTQASSTQQPNNPNQSQSNTPQLDLSVEFIDYIKKYLLVPGNQYEYKGICNNGLQYNNSIIYGPNSKIKNVIPQETLYDFLREAKSKGCSNSPETLLSLVHLIGEYTKQNPNSELIVIAQTPWKNIDNKTKANLKQEVTKITHKENVKKIFFCGYQDNNLIDIFSTFKKTGTDVNTSGNELGGIENEIQNIAAFLKKTNSQSNP